MTPPGPATIGSAGSGALAVELVGARKAFGQVEAVRSVDLTIEQGEIVGIIGPSGSGKTTTIRLLLGLYEPSDGAVRVYDRDPARFTRPDREEIGYLPQHFLLYPELTVRENLEFVAGAYGLGWRTRRARIERLLERVDLTDARDRLASDISGGMQRRLALASALVHDPEFIVLDEPTAGIDPVLRARIWQMFRDMKQDGRTLVVTTQYVTEAEYCDRVVLISEGRAIATGTPDELRQAAFGGEMVRVTIPDLDRAVAREVLAYPFVRGGRRDGENSLLLVVDEASGSIPRITERLREIGLSVSAIEEHRQPFDDVFVALLEKQGEQVETAA